MDYSKHETSFVIQRITIKQHNLFGGKVAQYEANTEGKLIWLVNDVNFVRYIFHNNNCICNYMPKVNKLF